MFFSWSWVLIYIAFLDVHTFLLSRHLYSTRDVQPNATHHAPQTFPLKVIASGAAPTFPLNPLQHRHRSGPTPRPSLQNPARGTNQPHRARTDSSFGPNPVRATTDLVRGRDFLDRRRPSAFLSPTLLRDASDDSLVSISGVGGQSGLRRLEALDLTEGSARLGRRTCVVEHRSDEQAQTTQAGSAQKLKTCKSDRSPIGTRAARRRASSNGSAHCATAACNVLRQLMRIRRPFLVVCKERRKASQRARPVPVATLHASASATLHAVASASLRAAEGGG